MKQEAALLRINFHLGVAGPVWGVQGNSDAGWLGARVDAVMPGAIHRSAVRHIHGESVTPPRVADIPGP